MGPFCRRIQFHEIGDQKWLPRYFHAKFQDFLTFYWTFHLRGLQVESPAAHVASVLARVLPQAGKGYTYVDFCAGAGGPTSVIERLWNDKSGQQEGNSSVDFVLTDLHPNISAWSEASKGRKNLTFIEQPVDATMTPASLKSRDGRKIFRLYNLSFHHFDDHLASSILRESLETSDGFGIFELQERTFTSFTNITLIVLFGLLITPLYFWRSPAHLFFTYVIPLVPLIVLYDGYVSALRTRTPAEILALAKGCSASLGEWDIISGHDLITWPTGYMTWVVGIKRSS